MDFSELTAKRKSVRQYTGEVPTESEMQYVLAAADNAPCTANQGFHISVVRDQDIMREAEICTARFFGKSGATHYLYGAPVWIIFSAKLADSAPANMPVTKDMVNGVVYWNVGGILQNMMLAAENIGLGSCAINTTIVALCDNDSLRQKLMIPEGYIAIGSTVFGKTDYDFPKREFKNKRFSTDYIG